SVLGGVGVFRRELGEHRATLVSATPWCLVGSAAGTAALLASPASAFKVAVPWLIGSATVLFALAPLIVRGLASRGHDHRRSSLLGPGVLVAAAYGGYFGAGLGIVLLAVLALALDEEILTLQGLRVALGLMTNLLAAVVFVIRGHLAVSAVVVLAVSTLLGGWAGARVMRRMPPALVRGVVIAVGVVTTVRLAIG
ncbi:MAG: sulfite exporter TauE/SafE family protein, partial [Acidobacteriota bacterium]|nr:sulfite exporter TauE/SafE family protein [Acidobacteriota bacterium]